MRVFITGGTGLVGRAIVRALLEDGQDVCVLTRDTEKARETLGEGPALLPGV